MNVICLMGRLTADPELKTTQNGVSVTSFTLAVDRAYTPKGQEKQTDFIQCVAWRNTAEFVSKYFRKGQRISLTGSLQSRKYTDKEGNNRTAFEVVADQVFFAESKQDSGNSYASAQTPSVAPSNVTPIAPAQTVGFSQNVGFEEMQFEDEDLPF